MSTNIAVTYNTFMNNVRAKEQIKSLMALNGVTMKQLSEMLTHKIQKNYSVSSLSQKLNRGSISYNEVMLIADILGFKVNYERKEQNNNI